MLKFSLLEQNTLFGQIWSKRQNCLIKLKLCAYYAEYAEFHGKFHQSCFGPKIYFLDKFGAKNENFLFFTMMCDICTMKWFLKKLI